MYSFDIPDNVENLYSWGEGLGRDLSVDILNYYLDQGHSFLG